MIRSGAPREGAFVAFDVASRRRWIGKAMQKDVRQSAWIKVPELPWELRFDFLQIEEDDGSRRWGVFGFELGEPRPREGLGQDPAETELTHERLAVLWAKFERYRRLAEDLLIPTPTSVEHAAKTRAAMNRRTGRALTDDYLALLVAEWRARRKKPDAIYDMAEARSINRSTLWRQLRKAEERGLVPEGLPRRNRGAQSTA